MRVFFFFFFFLWGELPKPVGKLRMISHFFFFPPISWLFHPEQTSRYAAIKRNNRNGPYSYYVNIIIHESRIEKCKFFIYRRIWRTEINFYW